MKCDYELNVLQELSECTDHIYHTLRCLEKAIADINRNEDSLSLAKTYEPRVIPQMQALRAYVDLAETMTAYEDWPYPTYGDLLFGIKN